MDEQTLFNIMTFMNINKLSHFCSINKIALIIDYN